MSGSSILPTVFDCRTQGVISPPKDQGNCESCSAFAVAATIGALLSIAQKNGPLIEVSAGYLHTCLGNAGTDNPATVCGNTVDLQTMVELVQSTGYILAVDGDYPFDPASCSTTQPPVKVKGAPRVAGENDAKSKLVATGPIVAEMFVWPDFFTYSIAKAPTYSPDMTQQGYLPHSVCVVGFNTQGWIIKNSRGLTWGDQGFAVVPYGVCALIEGDAPPGRYPPPAFELQIR
jgi:C1A family cysteine protease